jgi:hypothetical protein
MPQQKIREINDVLSTCSDFEKSFIADNFIRVEQYGDATRFSEKQIAIIDRVHKQRVTEGKAYEKPKPKDPLAGLPV